MTNDHVHALPLGSHLGEYRLDEVLGSGGYGITYRAYDAHLDKYMAIKEYLPGDIATRTEEITVVPLSNAHARDYNWGLEEFLDEARTLARFKHPNLNEVYRYFEANGTAYMVLEYIHGETLEERLNREMRLSEQALRQLLEEVLSGLAVVHKANYVHRDIKPDNLILREEDGSAVLLDFGAARLAVGARSQSLKAILTPPYAPIEQYADKLGRIGPWTDIYALGMVAYRCICELAVHDIPDGPARKMTQQDDSMDLTPAVEVGRGSYTPELLEAIDWAIEVDRSARPQEAAEWRQALAGDGRVKRPPEPPATVRHWTSIALVALLVVSLGVGVWWNWDKWFDPGPDDDYAGLMGNYMASFGEAIKNGNFDDARSYLATIRELQPDSQVLVDMGQRLDLAIQAREDHLAIRAGMAEVTRLLDEAEDDLEALRLTTPPGNNAWEKYQRILELEPENEGAIAGKARVVESYMESFGAALEREEFDQASGYLDTIRGLQPDSMVLAEGEETLEYARQEWVERLVGEMAPISGGTFLMGALTDDGAGEYIADDDERPPGTVTVKDFKLGKYEVTVGQFRRFVQASSYEMQATGCYIYNFTEKKLQWTAGISWHNPGYAIKDNQPVICVGWEDVQAFITWLSEMTGESYRLPSDAEWEYAARAGQTTVFNWGNSIGKNKANCRNEDCGDQWNESAPVGSFSANDWGLHDMHGNVWEWVQDCWNDNYTGAPGDGSAWTIRDCNQRVIRSGSFRNPPVRLRSSNRHNRKSSHSYYDLGFRLVQDQ